MGKLFGKVGAEVGESLRRAGGTIVKEMVPGIVAIALLIVGWFAVVPIAQNWLLPQFGVYPELEETEGDGTVRMPELGLEADWGLEYIYAQPLADGRRGVNVDGDPFHPAGAPAMELWLAEDDVEIDSFDAVEQSAYGGVLRYGWRTDSTETGRLTGILEFDDKIIDVRCRDQYRRTSTITASGRWCLPLIGALRPLTPSDEDYPRCIDRRRHDSMERAEPRPLPESMTCSVEGEEQ